MASPHIAGLAMTLIAKNPAQYDTPAKVTKAISALAAKNSSLLPPVPQETTTLIGFNGL